jgi:photosystem II stability/assembly factor-like uncharacterized protein
LLIDFPVPEGVYARWEVWNMRAKIFRALFLSVLLVSVLACGFPLELGLDAAPTSTQTSTTTSPQDEEVDELTELPLPTITFTATEKSNPTATLSPTGGLPVFISPEIFSIQLFSPDKGWAVAQGGGRLLATEDGGETWLDVTPPDLLPLPPGVNSLGVRPFFLDSQMAWFTPSTTAADTLFFTRDGGRTWSAADIPFAMANYFFLDQKNGFALEDLGAGVGSHYVALHRTSDGGTTWTEVFAHEPGESKSLPESGTKNGVTFINRDRGFISGTIPMEDYFHFYVTNDGGATWMQEMDISLPGVFSGSFLDTWQPIFFEGTIGFLPVRASGADGNLLLIYRSEDAGETWAFQGSVPNGQDVDFINGRVGWVAGDAGLFKTADGGVSWEVVITAGVPAGEDFLDVDFVDGDHGWLLTYLEGGNGPSRKLYRTDDGGENWILLQP